MKKLTILFMLLITLLISGCSKEASDQLQNLSNKNNKYVLMVKNGNPTSYPDSTYGTSFENFFASPTWKYFESGDDRDIVEFTGDCTYQEVRVKARLQFILDVKNGTFEAGALSFNEVPQNQLITAAIFSKVFEDEILKVTVPVVTPELSYIRYRNDRYGFSIGYPSLLTTSSESDNNDGIILSTPDDVVNLIVYGSNNINNETALSIYNNLLKDNINISYKQQEDNWMVVSWVEDDKIVYQKSVVGSGSINTYIIKYPSKLNNYYSPIISQLNNSFKTPDIQSFH